MSAPLVQVGPSDGLDVTAPLLDPEMQASASEPSPNHGDLWVVTPLPVRQISVLGFAAIAEPVCVNFIFPFINEMLAGMSNGPKQLAYRSGIFFGCFSLAQFCCVYFWGTLSDRTGRKPVLLICLACGILSTAAFGVSTTFVQALIFRMITGASYGDVPVLRSAMGDITDSTNQARAFSFLPLAWMIGSTLAPLMGGFLSHPSKRFPKRFGKSQFLIDHPYALPCFVSSTLSLLAFIVVALFLRETLQDKPHHDDDESRSPSPETDAAKADDHNSDEILAPEGENDERSPIASPQPQPPPNYGSTNTSSDPSPESASNEEPHVSGFSALRETNAPPRPSTFKILADSTVRRVLLSYFCLAMISTSNDVIFALWMFLSIKNGGVGFTPAQIATALSAGSILGTLIMVFVFPALHRRVGTLLIYRCAMFLDFVFICCYPIVYFIAKHYVPKHEDDKGDFDSLNDWMLKEGSGGNGGKEGGKGVFGVWEGVPVGIIVGIVVMLVVKAFAGMTWGCNMILVTASAPTPRSLGTVNSMAQMSASLARAIGPPIYSSIFAISIGSGILGGKGIIWIFMGAMAIFSLLVSFFVREGEQDWRRARRVV